jgi:hypothetical protein
MAAHQPKDITLHREYYPDMDRMVKALKTDHDPDCNQSFLIREVLLNQGQVFLKQGLAVPGHLVSTLLAPALPFKHSECFGGATAANKFAMVAFDAVRTGAENAGRHMHMFFKNDQLPVQINC